MYHSIWQISTKFYNLHGMLYFILLFNCTIYYFLPICTYFPYTHFLQFSRYLQIFDVFNQIFTTAFILNTGYWPFFSSVKGQCLCVCGRFGLHCRHIKNEYHWIDMQPIENEQGAARFFPRIYGNIYPQVFRINLNFILVT